VNIKLGLIVFFRSQDTFVGILARGRKQFHGMCACGWWQWRVRGWRHKYQHLPFSSEAPNAWKFVIEAFLSAVQTLFSRNLAEVEFTIWHLILNQVLCVPRASSFGNAAGCDLSKMFLGLAFLIEQSKQPVLEFRKRCAEHVLPQGEKCKVKS
jgi:hypothetical protein